MHNLQNKSTEKTLVRFLINLEDEILLYDKDLIPLEQQQEVEKLKEIFHLNFKK